MPSGEVVLLASGFLPTLWRCNVRKSRDSAIVKLQRVKHDPMIQAVAVPTRDDLEKCKGEIVPLVEGFRSAVGYFEVECLQRARDHLQNLKRILRTC